MIDRAFVIETPLVWLQGLTKSHRCLFARTPIHYVNRAEALLFPAEMVSRQRLVGRTRFLDSALLLVTQMEQVS